MFLWGCVSQNRLRCKKQISIFSDGFSVSPLIDALKPLISSPRGISSCLLKAYETLIGLGGPSLAKLFAYSSRQAGVSPNNLELPMLAQIRRKRTGNSRLYERWKTGICLQIFSSSIEKYRLYLSGTQQAFYYIKYSQSGLTPFAQALHRDIDR